MRKIIVTRDPAKINLAVLKLVEQLGDLTSLSALASDAEYARSQAVAAAAAAQADQTAAAAAKAGAEAAQASAASSSGTAGAHASAASASATTALLARDDAAISKAGSEAAQAGSEAAQAASEGARDASIVARDQSQAAKAASEAARDTVQSSIYIGPIAPTVTRSGMVWVDESANDIKIRNAANTAWVLLSDFIGALEYDRPQTLAATARLQAATNIGALVYDQGQSLTDPQKAQARANIGAGVPVFTGGFNTIETVSGIVHYNTSDRPMFVSAITKTPSATPWMSLYVRATPSNAWYGADLGHNANHPSVYGTVPPGWQYKLEGVETVITLRTHH